MEVWEVSGRASRKSGRASWKSGRGREGPRKSKRGQECPRMSGMGRVGRPEVLEASGGPTEIW